MSKQICYATKEKYRRCRLSTVKGENLGIFEDLDGGFQIYKSNMIQVPAWKDTLLERKITEPFSPPLLHLIKRSLKPMLRITWRQLIM
jgi:hypothetical protein